MMPQDAKPYAHDNVLPDAASKVDKKAQVAALFDSIAPRYDFLNHFLSAGIDKSWRKKTIAALLPFKPKTILDVATGTADLAIEAMSLNPKEIIGIDISKNMLDIGRQKITGKYLHKTIKLQLEDSAQLSFEDHHFDAVMCAYGVRNFEFLEQGLKEMQRVLKPGGAVAILEFSRPKGFGVKHVFQFYFKHILPKLGNKLAKNKNAYTYLHDSANAFPDGEDFCAVLSNCGFKEVKAQPLFMGVSTLYTGRK